MTPVTLKVSTRTQSNKSTLIANYHKNSRLAAFILRYQQKSSVCNYCIYSIPYTVITQKITVPYPVLKNSSQL